MNGLKIFNIYRNGLFVTQILATITQKYNNMIEFSKLVSVTLLGTTQKTFQFLADDFAFEPSATEDSGGVYWDCGKTFVVDMPEGEALEQLKMPRNAIVTLSKLTRMRPECDPNVIRIGTDTIPARVYLSPHLNKAQLVVSCKMLRNPL